MATINKPTKADLNACKTHDDFVRVARKCHMRVTNASRHTKISNENGATFVPRHKGDLRTGTRAAIIKQLLALLAAIGLVAHFILSL